MSVSDTPTARPGAPLFPSHLQDWVNHLNYGDRVGITPRHEAGNGWNATFVHWNNDSPRTARIDTGSDQRDVLVSCLGKPF